MNNTYSYKLPNSDALLDFSVSPKSFIPTATSDFLIKSTLKVLRPKHNSLLDLGCGVGIVGLSLFKEGQIQNLFSSDLSNDGTNHCEINSKKFGIQNTIRTGDCFEPWDNMKFDVIVDDISGISEEVAKISKWFSNVPCNSGADGTDLTIKVIDSAPKYLNEGGLLIFPVISLSDHEKIIKYAQKNFKNVELISSNNWFLPEDMSDKVDVLNDLKSRNLITFDFKFGKYICFTDIYMAFK